MAGVSVVIVSYHTGPVLEYCLDRALAQANLAEVILVDNGNPPPVVEKLKASAHPHLKLITGHGNVGFARGCNMGAKAATGDYIFLLNPDCLLPENAFAPLMAALESTPGATLAGVNLLNADGTPQRGARRELLTPETALSEALGLHRFLKLSRLNRHEGAMPDAPCEVPAISGACMFLRKKDYEALGGLDEGYFLHVEDLDLCKRVQQSGGKTLFMPEVKVVHLLSTSDAPSAFVERCKAQGFVRYFRMHFTSSPVIPANAGIQNAGNDKPIIARRIILLLAILGIWARYGLKRLFPRRANAAHVKASKQLLLLERYLREPNTPGGWAGKSVLITGATSPVGLILIARLLAAGAYVYAVSRRPPLFTHERLHWICADITLPSPEEESVPSGIDAFNGLAHINALTLIHCAPLWTLPWLLESLLSLCRPIAITAFSSTSLFGKAGSADTHERFVVEQLGKAECSIAAIGEAYAIRHTILRPTLIYGAGLDGNVTRIARTIRRFGFFPLYPPASGLRQPVHADDLALAALQATASAHGSNRSYNLSGGETLTYRAMVERIFATLGRKTRIIPLPFLPQMLDVLGALRHNSHVNGEMARRMNDDLVFAHTDATNDFGYQPRAFLSGSLADIDGARA